MLLEWLWSAMGFVGTLATKRVVDRSVDRALQAKSPVPRLSVIRDYQEVPAGSVRQLFGRVKVIAVGKGTLRNVRGYLCGIERLSGGRPIKKIFTETFPLIWSYDEHVDSRDVVEGVPWTMDVVMCQEGSPLLSVRIRNGQGHLEPLLLDDEPLAAGEYRFSTRVISEDGQNMPVDLDFAFRSPAWPSIQPISDSP